METVITLVAAALLIALGTRLIHRLNAQHDARIAAHHFDGPYPSLSRPPGHGNPRPPERITHRRPTDTRP
ncbi:hypothetical protein EF903_13160 [Streptomyces sp. WAC05292]|uniref:hypothetical protein n=1 Tax=Streptomyces sp. WAC05292 TaxID=2487418 RepID=UPI000F73A440|nr:hypothetical protein [Streptomyces sp. WAC05292]RSS89968.1 hypothetical protein EF903_13160 [Streptomyces sp. WAC05292]